LKFSLQEASPETFGYTLYFIFIYLFISILCLGYSIIGRDTGLF